MRQRPAILVVFFALMLSACAKDPETAFVPPRPQAQSLAELTFARATLNSIQEPSFAENREFCGFISVDAFGRFMATEPIQGRANQCVARLPRGDFTVLASYHSHGAYAEDYDSEVPSYQDLASDITAGIDGYVATPGGRMWYIDSALKRTRLVCGPNCLISDPDYRPQVFDPLRSQYSLQDLAKRETR